MALLPSTLLPWRVRRYLDDAALWSMRFRPARSVLRVGGHESAASLLAGGDIVLGRGVHEAIRDRGPGSVFAPLKSVLDGCDLRVANLESTLTHCETPPGTFGGVLKAPPESVEALSAAGFDAVTLANNHCMDFGPEGLGECLRILDTHAIRHCGAGDSPLSARRPAMLEAKGIRVGMLGYTDDYRPAWPPAAAAAGPAPARDELILQDLEAIRPSADIVVLQLHWGVEFAMYPWLSHRTRARRYAEAGADLVLCHHAHVPMGVEVWKRSVIAYGLGNLVFPASRDLTRGHPWKHRSVVLKVAFDRSGISHVEMIPVETRPDFSVAPSTGARRAQMLGALGKASKGLQDSKKLARLEADQLAREALGWLESFDPPGGLDSSHLPEMAALLTAPRQQRMIEWLVEQPSSVAREVGGFLGQVAAGAGSVEGGPSHVWLERRDALRPRIGAFAAEFGTSRVPLWKVP
jgi:poly-gamma-glutamate capsule biosynthesis protein CapA/YwtB (metallophosphatase superfamily)